MGKQRRSDPVDRGSAVFGPTLEGGVAHAKTLAGQPGQSSVLSSVVFTASWVRATRPDLASPPGAPLRRSSRSGGKSGDDSRG